MQRLVYAALLFLFSCLLVQAEEIQLKDGTKINGRIVSVSGDTFQVKTAYGEIQVPRQQIVTIGFPENEPGSAPSESADRAPRLIDESLEGTSYTNRSENFRVTFPLGWKLAPELRRQSKDIAAALKSPDETLLFFVTPEKFPGTLATYEVLAETLYQMKYKDYEKLSQSDVEADGRKGLRLTWHAKNPQANDAAIKALVYIIPYEGRMVRLSFITLEPLYDEAAPVFEKIASTYRTGNSPK